MRNYWLEKKRVGGVMRINKIILDDSILNFDEWLTDKILDRLTEDVFGVEIISKKVLKINNGPAPD